MKNLSMGSDAFRIGGQIKRISVPSLEQHASGIVLLGISDDQAIKNVGGRIGARFAPAKIREMLYRFVAPKIGIPLYDLGDLSGLATIAKTHQLAKNWIQSIHASHHIPIILGGGHDLAYAEAAALLESTPKGSVGYLNVDAHLDLRPTDKGITSGSPWNLLVHHPQFHKRKCQLMEFGIQPHCNSPDLFAIASAHKIQIEMLDHIRNSKESCELKFSSALKKLATKHKAVQISLDIDSVQCSQAPGCSAPQVRGFSADEFIRFSELSGLNKKVRSFGIYEVSPPLDFDHHTSRLAAQSILGFIQGVARRNSRL